MNSGDRNNPRLGEMDPALERVYRRGHSIRRRRKFVRAASATLSLVLVVSAAYGVVQLRNDSELPPVTIATGPARPSSEPTVSPTAKVSTPSSSSPAASSSPTSTSRACDNSFDPKCGPFSWLTRPGSNKPVTLSITVSPSSPKVGQTVTLRLTVTDPDASNVTANMDGGWKGEGPFLSTPLSCTKPGYGPWTPPEPKSGSRTYTFTHVYSEAGTFTLHFWGISWSGPPWSSGSCPGAETDPYAGVAEEQKTIVVTGGPSPSPSPTSTTTPTPTPTST